MTGKALRIAEVDRRQELPAVPHCGLLPLPRTRALMFTEAQAGLAGRCRRLPAFFCRCQPTVRPGDGSGVLSLPRSCSGRDYVVGRYSACLRVSVARDLEPAPGHE